MVSQPNTGERACAICRRSCEGQPRIKDKKGRYFHRECFAKAKAKLKAKKAAQAPAAKQKAQPPTPTAFDDPTPSEASPVPAIPVASPSCPNCGAINPPDKILCTTCGFNRQTGDLTPQALAAAPAPEPIKKARSPKVSVSGGAMTGLFTNPAIIWGGVAVLFVVLFLAAKTSDGMAAVYIGATVTFSLAVGIWLIVAAFIEGTMHGILSLFCDIYKIYFVYSINSNGHLKIAFTIAILASILMFVLSPDLLQAWLDPGNSGFDIGEIDTGDF